MDRWGYQAARVYSLLRKGRGVLVHGLWLLGFALVVSLPGRLLAQSGNTRWDVGGALGANAFTGDLNMTALPLNLGGHAGLLARYELTEMYALRLNLQGGLLQAKYDSTRYVLAGLADGASVARFFVNLDFGVDIHFLPYQVKDFQQSFKDHSPAVPYATFGIGLHYAVNGRVALTIPMGLGVKIPLGARWTLAPEVRFQKIFTDQVDGYEQWPDSKRYGVWHKRDWISQLTLTFTYRLLTNWTTCPAYLSGDAQILY